MYVEDKRKHNHLRILVELSIEYVCTFLVEFLLISGDMYVSHVTDVVLGFG